jgi:hypothetical protein
MVAQTKRMLTEVAKLDDLRHGHLAEKASELASSLAERFDREELTKKAVVAQEALMEGGRAVVKMLAKRPYTLIGLGVVAAVAGYYFLHQDSVGASTKKAVKQARKGKKRLAKAFH